MREPCQHQSRGNGDVERLEPAGERNGDGEIEQRARRRRKARPLRSERDDRDRFLGSQVFHRSELGDGNRSAVGLESDPPRAPARGRGEVPAELSRLCLSGDRQPEEAPGRGTQGARVIRIGASRRKDEARRSEPFGDSGERSEVAGVLDMVEIEPDLAGSRVEAGKTRAGQVADREQAARRVGVGQRLEDAWRGEQRRPGESGEHLLTTNRGEKLLGRQHQMQGEPGLERLENKVRPLENRFRAPRSPNPADGFDSLVARALDHGARS